MKRTIKDELVNDLIDENETKMNKKRCSMPCRVRNMKKYIQGNESYSM